MQFLNWKEVSYKESTQRQLELLEKVAGGEEDAVVFCYHPPVVTLGRSTEDTDLVDWHGETIETSRGGRATYHGPNQVVIYPILNLKDKKDVHAYLRLLESVTIDCLKSLGIEDAEARTVTVPQSDGKDLSLTGVWVGERKIASIGIAVKKWVTYHGIAINLFEDPNAFKGINPCGFSSSIMTSVEAILGKRIERDEFINQFQKSVQKLTKS